MRKMAFFFFRDTVETHIDGSSRFETPIGGKMIAVQTGKRGQNVRKRPRTAERTKPYRARGSGR